MSCLNGRGMSGEGAARVSMVMIVMSEANKPEHVEIVRAERAKIGAIMGQDEETGIRDDDDGRFAKSDADAAMLKKPWRRYITAKTKKGAGVPGNTQQVAFVPVGADACRNQSLYPGDLLHCSLNGQKNDEIAGWRAKALGCWPGIPDLFVPAPVGGFRACLSR